MRPRPCGFRSLSRCPCLHPRAGVGRSSCPAQHRPFQLGRLRRFPSLAHPSGPHRAPPPEPDASAVLLKGHARFNPAVHSGGSGPAFKTCLQQRRAGAPVSSHAPLGLTRLAADFASLAAEATVRQCLLSQAPRALLFARVRHGLSSPANAGGPHIPPLSGAQRPLPIPPVPRELGAVPFSRRHRSQPGRRTPSPFAAQALLGRRPHTLGRPSLSRHLCAPPFSGPSFQSLPPWGGTGGAPLPPRHPPQGFRKTNALQRHVSHPRHRLTPACSGLAALAADARR